MLNTIKAPGPDSSTLGPVQAPEWVKEDKLGDRKLEYSGAIKIPNTIVAPKPSSFTSVLIHALKSLKESQLEGQWSVQELLDEIRLRTSDSSTSQLLVRKSEYKSSGHMTSSHPRKTGGAGPEEGSQRMIQQKPAKGHKLTLVFGLYALASEADSRTVRPAVQSSTLGVRGDLLAGFEETLDRRIGIAFQDAMSNRRKSFDHPGTSDSQESGLCQDASDTASD
ncbi:MAG: hypothetical protein Q9180_006779, partial [Flavoplaca navasiana]